MRPVATVAEVRAADASALAQVSQATLVSRAGTAVALSSLRLLGSGYGHRVVVVAGKGNNGADGRVAASILRRRGARVTMVDAGSAPDRLPRCDLVLDAAYGTGFRGSYEAPRVPTGAAVLAVDVPSGIDGDTGEAGGRPMAADRTVTFAALKPGLLQGDGARLAGEVEVADIGVPVEGTGIGLVEDADVPALVPRRARESHKWASAVAVVAGSPGMEGAAALAAGGASHTGAGMVRLAVPGSAEAAAAGIWPVEAVRLPLPAEGWADEVLAALDRCRALVVGPGLGRAEHTATEIRKLVGRSPVPVVADADALYALEGSAVDVVGGRPVVLTPHDGEYARLAGERPGPDRVAAARRLAARTGAVVLLKGSLTAVGAPQGRVLLAAAGSPRLATAGTGDVLSGMVGALLARGVPPAEAAALGAHVHGRASARGPAEGLVAEDLPPLVAAWMTEAMGDG
ncbi:MAG: NAD(P)H-hydrate dehydratase [Acidimicrobiales bacterium]